MNVDIQKSQSNGEFAETKIEFDFFATGWGGDLGGIRAAISSIQNGVKWMMTNHAQRHPVDVRHRMSLKCDAGA